MVRLLLWLLVALAAWKTYSVWDQRREPKFSATENPAPLLLDAPRPRSIDAAAASPADRCDGRTQCTQMTSCEEATYFLRHCPGVKMDGDGDGVPCERQLCR